MGTNVQFVAKMPIKLAKKTNWYVASCPILDVHSQGETKELAKHNLEEALSLFFVSCFERGTLDAVLKNCGFRAVRTEAQIESGSAAHEQEYIDVPIPFLVDRNSGRECHA